MNSIQNQAQISYISDTEPLIVKTPNINTTIVDPNIHVVKSCCVESAQRGDTIRYTVSVINSGEIATSGNVVTKDYLDSAGSHVADSSVVYRNNLKLNPAHSLDELTRDTFWLDYITEGNVPTITFTSLLPGDVIIASYSVLIDEETPLINNELHNTATATYNLNANTITRSSDICTVNVNYSKLLANKRGRAEGHDLSNMFYSIELINDGTSSASDIEITENFPNSYQPDSGYDLVKQDIAIINYIKYPNDIEQQIVKSQDQKTETSTIYGEINAKYNRLRAQLQDVLAKIAEVSAMANIEDQRAEINTVTEDLIPDLDASMTLAENSYNGLFTPDADLDPEYSCIYTTIQTLLNAVQTSKDKAEATLLVDGKDVRASAICDAHTGGITLVNLCDLTNDAATMVAVVNRYIVTNAEYLQREFKILGMNLVPIYQPTYNAISSIVTTATDNLSACMKKRDEVVATAQQVELLMIEIMEIAFSTTDIIKEPDENYTIVVDIPKNKMTLTIKNIEIQPQTLIGTQQLNGHMDIYLNGHIEMDKF